MAAASLGVREKEKGREERGETTRGWREGEL